MKALDNEDSQASANHHDYNDYHALPAKRARHFWCPLIWPCILNFEAKSLIYSYFQLGIQILSTEINTLAYTHTNLYLFKLKPKKT